MNRINKIALNLISLLLIVNNSISISFAEEGDIRYYDVEIVIFQNTNPKYLTSERWNKNFVQIEPETFVQIGQPLPADLSEEYDPLLTFQYIENTEYRLNDIVTSLNESSRYRVLLHSAWRQPGMSNTKALNVKINHFIPLESAFNDKTDIIQNELENINNNSVSEQVPNQFSDFNSTQETEPENSNQEEINKEGFVLIGYIKLILSRYLHLKVDLVYHEQKNEVVEQFISDEFGDDDTLPDVFRITQTRRLRSKELHYIDHPVISIITIITPYKIKKL